MQHLNEKQLRNLTVEQLDELRREIGHGISHLQEEIRLYGSKADYTRKRKLEKYLSEVKAVLQHKRNTGQK
ncbi:hypothetical protein BI049_gp099 [Salmonella phage vB_SnwM_CGG4-1]|uniref:Uncharacterized protein n=1 Tax=Salmonella phage vB_SnwM_CGG4-1 TaxID=1815631 RepID=A0A1B0VVF6_9CAUD|nr:hypothetical protein BI049_gp099 [Salmonella phage vB_SnwM_CGG4-1]ANA49453.1 hypothetical protein CGG41_098 [Salmonella phage vB_SnwM_CGG4-1]